MYRRKLCSHPIILSYVLVCYTFLKTPDKIMYRYCIETKEHDCKKSCSNLASKRRFTQQGNTPRQRPDSRGKLDLGNVTRVIGLDF